MVNEATFEDLLSVPGIGTIGQTNYIIKKYSRYTRVSSKFDANITHPTSNITQLI